MDNHFVIARAFIEREINSIPKNMYNEWFGSGAVGEASEAGDTVAAIYAAVAGGYTLQTFTSSNAAWSVPPDLAAAAEAYAFAIGGGGKGGAGGTSGGDGGGAGGSSGGFTSVAIDPSALASTLAITVGAAASTNLSDGGQTKIMSGATTLVQSLVDTGSIGLTQGFIESNSSPGRGGRGGPYTASGAEEGEGNAFAVGGTAGANMGGSNPGGPGGDGGTGQTNATPIAGGGGGGGGAGAGGIGQVGGVGGAGGFPGAGSGGGGTRSGGSGAASGTPGNGFAALMWR